MELHDQENDHPSKRRKLDNGLPTAHSILSSYVPIARAAFRLRVADVETKDGSSNDSKDREVAIRSMAQVGDTLHLVITAQWLKSAATIQVFTDPVSVRILEDCLKVDSWMKVSKDPRKTFLVCYTACLDQFSSEPSLTFKLLWHNTHIAREKINPELRDMFVRHTSVAETALNLPTATAWDVQEFYQNVHIPSMAEKDAATGLKIDLLHCQLYPFQQRAVKWMLEREGVRVQRTSQLVPHTEAGQVSAMMSAFRNTTDIDGASILVNPVLGVACSAHDDVKQHYSSVKGGLLGEAMGLGKTVEMIALMSLHNMQNSPLQPTGPTKLKMSGATLIITPPTILEQWKQEIQAHAPSLRVFHYNGVKSMIKKGLNAAVELLTSYDVVLTTYNVISKELHYVMEKPDRALRAKPRFEPPKSPLDQILWWRVCLDEAQMIESGVSAAATVARLIPRVNAWAVTGTPLKQSHKDLFGLLLFLRYEPWCNSYRLWEYLLTYHRPLFRKMIGEIAIRHSKEIVRDELRLPPQIRHTITISFSNIEQAHYSQLFYDMYEDCGLDKHGAPQDDHWDPNHPKMIEKMRTWLTRLRQTCLHPEVGGRNRKALGRGNIAGPLRTVQQVLDVMMDQNESMLRTEQRNMLIAQIRQGQMQENAKDQNAAMQLYQRAYEKASEFVDECRQALKSELSRQQLVDRKEQPADESEDEVEEDAQHLSTRQRLRSALEVKHICVFFMANIFYQMKTDETRVKPESEDFVSLERQETQSYDEAKKIRSELLTEVVRKANRRIAKVRTTDSHQEFINIPEMALNPDDYAGIESRKVFEKLYHYCKAMNEQAAQLHELREKMVKFLQQALIDEDEGVELQGDEYENSTKHQDEMYAYMEALRALYADRNDAITGQENLLIRSEMKGFLRAAREGEGPAPELMIKLLAERETKRINIGEQGSLRGILAEIRALVSALDFQAASGSTRAKAELHIAAEMLQRANKLVTVQSKTLTVLEQEVQYFRNSMNARLEYYKALQKISDTVAPYREEDIGKPIDERQFRLFVKDEDTARNKCSNFQAKQRYLVHLQNESTADSGPRICTICQSEFEIGAITSCGHVFCKEDLQLWYSAHGNCPVCKRRLRNADFFDVTYKPAEMTVQAEKPTAPESPTDGSDRPLTNSIYSDIGEKQLNEIKNIEIRGASFGSKVDTICRHLHWLREQDPGSKTIIFSQFREVLDILGRAFKQNAISYARCDDKSGIEDFKSNPAVECFLLHARAHSAGLNIVVASHVILCEPLINTAIELQAIARVHRIGQHRATTVWMYLISDTVEESIYDISVKRRLAHMKGRGNSDRSGTQTPTLVQESALDAANSSQLQAADLSKALAPGRNGGEMVSKEDLWPCLFGSHEKGIRKQVGFTGELADSVPADGEVGRFLRFEAAERRRM